MTPPAGSPRTIRVALEGDLRAAVRHGAAGGGPVRVLGSHAAAATWLDSGTVLRMRRYRRILELDRERRRVKVETGVPLWALDDGLALRGLALPSFADNATRTLGGALATGAHGSGLWRPGLAGRVVGLELVRPDGSLLTCSLEERPEILKAALCSLGAPGVLSTVTVECVPAGNVRAVEELVAIEQVISGLELLARASQHLDFEWNPRSRWVVLRRAEPTGRHNQGRNLVTDLAERRELRRKLLSRLDDLTARHGGAAAIVDDILPRVPPRRYVDRASRVLSRRWFVIPGVEYAVPVAMAGEVLEGLAALAGRRPPVFDAPCRLRLSAADDVPLSPAFGRDSAHISVGSWCTPPGTLDELVRPIMDAVGGRPHWGTVYTHHAATLSPLYPGWHDWQALRAELDPDGVFVNPYVARVLGGPAPAAGSLPGPG